MEVPAGLGGELNRIVSVLPKQICYLIIRARNRSSITVMWDWTIRHDIISGGKESRGGYVVEKGRTSQVQGSFH